MIDYNGRFCMSSAATAGNRAFGVDRGLPFPLADIAEAEAILLVGVEPGRHHAAGHAVLRRGPGRRRHAHRRRPAAHRDRRRVRRMHLAPLPGTDLALANGLLHLVIKEGLVDEDYIADADERDSTRSRRRSAPYWPDRVERITGVPVSSCCEIVHGPGRGAETAMILTARGAEQHSTGTDTAQAYINLALALGLPGRPAAATAPSPARATGRAAANTGRRPISYPATAGSPIRMLALTSPPCGASTRTRCPGPGSPPSRCSTGWARRRCPGAARARVQHRGVGAGRQSGRRSAAALDLLVVCDIFLSETAELADVVLPTAQWAEEEGTMTNLEGRVIRRRRALPPPDGVRDDLELLKALADRLGRGRYFSGDPRDGVRGAAAGRAPAVSPTTPASPTSESTRSTASSGPARATDHPGHAAAVRRQLPDTRRACQLHPGRIPRAATRLPDARLPVRADDRPPDGAVPERHSDPARAQPIQAQVPTRSRSSTRIWLDGSRSGTAIWSRSLSRRGHRRLPGACKRRTSVLTVIFVPFPLGRRLGRQRC